MIMKKENDRKNAFDIANIIIWKWKMLIENIPTDITSDKCLKQKK